MIENSKTSNNYLLNGIIPDFDFKKYGIGFEDILTEAEQLLKPGNEYEIKGANNFPVEVFPPPFQEIIKATHDHLGFSIDFISASMLYAVSVAIGNTYKVEIKRGFREAAVLYIAIVGRTGTNKSHPLSFALQPLMEHDMNTYKQYEQQRLEYDKAIILTKKERDRQDLAEPVKPVWQKILLSDFTPEALAEVHKFNKRGIGVSVDELAGWFKNFNRYNNGSEMEFWLSTWSGKPVNIDRKSGEPTYIPFPFICVIGTIQNSILKELAKGDRTKNGFFDRILFVIPDDLKKLPWSETEINPDILTNWQSIIKKLLNVPIHFDETLNPLPEILHFTPEAHRLLFDWQRGNADQCNRSENEAICGIYSKLEMYAARLALVLEMIRWACNLSTKQAIGIEATRGALQLVEYFKRSAIKAYSIISNETPIDNLPTDKQNLYKALPDSFTTEMGLQIARSLNVPERTFKGFISKKDLFDNVKRGEYEKLF